MNFSGNFTTVNNEITELSPGVNEFLSGGGYRTAVGFPIGYMYGYETDGLYQNEAEANEALPDENSPQGPRPGDVRFVDNNGPAPEDAPAGQQFSGEADGVIDFNDRTYLGKTIPDFFYGLNFDFNWKNFDLNVFFQGVSGIQLYNEFRQTALNTALGGNGRNGLAESMNRWTGEGTSNSIPRAISSDPNSNGRYSDRFVEDAGFLRLRNLQLGYNIPQTLFGGNNVFKTARIYVSASNILTLTPYSGLDPEVMTYRSNGSQVGQALARGTEPEGGSGTDRGRSPIPRVFQVGLNIGF